MMTMLERAAGAMAREAGYAHPNSHHMRLAAAVLVAIREPDENTILASGMLDEDGRELAAAVWSDMIDAILNA